MGYNTHYSLDIHSGCVHNETFEAAARGCDIIWDAYSEGISCKWYDHAEDMTEFSKRFPDVLFKLHGEGEENEDLWNKYFLNGRMQVARAEITYPDFDRSKLT